MMISAPGFADSINTAINDQEFIGSVDGSTAVDVVAAGEATASAAALGNSADAANDAGRVHAENGQTFDGTATATAALTAETADIAASASTIFANGFAAEAPYGDVYVFSEQDTVSGSSAAASTSLTGGSFGGASASAANVANAVSAVSTYGDVYGYAEQDNNAALSAETVTDINDAAALAASSTAAGNTLTATSNTGSVDFAAVQRNGVVDTTASTSMASGYAYDGAGSAAAVGNSIYAGNEISPASIEGYQENNGYVRGESYVTLSEFGGSGSSSAMAMGNSALLGTRSYGSVDLNQNNFSAGGVEAVASFNNARGSNDGGVAVASSAAFGNAVTGSVCSYCEASIDGRSSQTSVGPVRATTTMTIGGPVGGAAGSAVAVGNSASYSVRTPGG